MQSAIVVNADGMLEPMSDPMTILHAGSPAPGNVWP